MPKHKPYEISQGFDDSTKNFKRADTKLAMLVYAALFLAFVCGGWFMASVAGGFFSEGTLYRHEPMPDVQLRWFYVQLTIVTVFTGLIFLLAKLRKQKVLSSSFNKSNTLKSLRAGLIICAAVYLLSLISPAHRPHNLRIREDLDFVLVSTYMFTIVIATGFFEEFTFRAYIGPRLYGSFKRKDMSMVFGGFLFAIMHGAIEIGAILLGGSPTWIWNMSFSRIILLTVVGALLQWFYAKYNNIWGPVAVHAFANSLSFAPLFMFEFVSYCCSV